MSGAQDFNLDDLEGIKRNDITPCVGCGKGVMHGGSPFAYRVRVETVIFDGKALTRAHGADQLMGPLSTVLGPDEDLAKVVDKRADGLLCNDCSLTLPIAALTLSNNGAG